MMTQMISSTVKCRIRNGARREIDFLLRSSNSGLSKNVRTRYETKSHSFDRYDAGVRRSSVDDIAHRGLRNPGDVADLVDRYVPFAAQFEQPFLILQLSLTIILLSECL